MGALPETSARSALKYEYFPTHWQAVLFRNWGRVPVERLAELMQTEEDTLRREGVEILSTREGESDDFDDMLRMARAALCHFQSAYNHACFVMAREEGDQTAMLQAIHAEREGVRRLIDLRKSDSRIGYEASNHYFYTLAGLAEKLVNLNWVEENLK